MRRKKQILLPVVWTASRGGNYHEDCVYSLSKYLSTAEGVAALRDAAAEVARRFGSGRFNSCSIVNARSAVAGGGNVVPRVHITIQLRACTMSWTVTHALMRHV